MEMVTVHFSKEELACKCGCGLLPPPGLLKKVEKVRQRYGRPLSVASGARCPDYNAKVSGTGRTGPTRRARSTSGSPARTPCTWYSS